MYDKLNKQDVIEIVKDWERKGGRADYVGNQNRRFLGIKGLILMIDESNLPMSLRPYYIDIPTYIERRLVE